MFTHVVFSADITGTSTCTAGYRVEAIAVKAIQSPIAISRRVTVAFTASVLVASIFQVLAKVGKW